MRTPVRIGLAGAGLIGQRHADAIAACSGATLAAIADPAESGRDFAKSRDIAWFGSLSEMFKAAQIDGVIIATPNQLHLPNALECIKQRCPVLVEKPITVKVSEAEQLTRAARKAGVAVLTGHHRRHNDLIRKARAIIDNGELGAIVSVQATCWFYKPDEYFNTRWRTKPGAGPVFINLIHDIDLLRHLCGEIETIQALQSNRIRQNQVEDTAAIMLRFCNGALGTINVSDTAVAPWSWELTARENPAYPATSQSCYLIGGAKASLSLPDLTIWRHEGRPGWWSPISATRTPFSFEDPLISQIRQFVAVINGDEAPLVSGEDGLKTLRVVEAVKHSASSGRAIEMQRRPED